MELKRLGVLSVAKLEAIIMALFGLVEGLFIGALGTVTVSMPMYRQSPWGTLGFLAVIVLPIVFGILGFVFGALGAFVYNLIAEWVGGIEMEFKK